MKTTSSEDDNISEIVMEEPTNDDSLPEGYLYTWRGLRCVKPSLKLTGSCVAEPGLHKLTCEHWISTPTPQPCGVNCYSPLYENEASRCAECCDMVQRILDTKLTPTERQKLARARTGFHVFYIALAVEHVAKHAPTTGSITDAVLHALDNTGRSCQPSRGPKDYDVDIEQTVRELREREKRERFAMTHPLTHHSKRSHSASSGELDDVVSPAAQKKKRKTSGWRDITPPLELAPGSKRKSAVPSPDDEGDERDVRNAKKLATPTKVLYGGATRSPHFKKTAQRLVPKRGPQDDGEDQRREGGKRIRDLKGPV